MSRLPWVLASLVALFSAPGPLGAQVSLPSTGAGVVAEPSGRFVISGVPAGTHRLRINVLGYRPLDRPVNVVAGEVTEVSLGLESAAVVLKGLVVTALGIERRARTLGVATQHIDDTRLGPIAPNVVASLSGRVPGVSITNATTQGGSSRIVIRGESSLLGNNQPLFVVDGIPVDNYIGVRQGVLADQGGYDYGTLINDLDLGSIESVTVLKGPNASSLYGSRASNGGHPRRYEEGHRRLGRRGHRRQSDRHVGGRAPPAEVPERVRPGEPGDLRVLRRRRKRALRREGRELGPPARRGSDDPAVPQPGHGRRRERAGHPRAAPLGVASGQHRPVLRTGYGGHERLRGERLGPHEQPHGLHPGSARTGWSLAIDSIARP